MNDADNTVVNPESGKVSDIGERRQRKRREADIAESLEVHGPGGWMAKLSGSSWPNIFCTLTIVAVGAAIWWSDEQRSKAFLEQHKITQELLSKAIDNQGTIVELLDANTYVLTLDDDEKKRLKIRMPDALRNRLRQ